MLSDDADDTDDDQYTTKSNDDGDDDVVDRGSYGDCDDYDYVADDDDDAEDPSFIDALTQPQRSCTTDGETRSRWAGGRCKKQARTIRPAHVTALGGTPLLSTTQAPQACGSIHASTCEGPLLSERKHQP